MNAVIYSGQAILAEDEMLRCRRIADVLAHDLEKRKDLAIETREAVYEAIGRYRMRADLVEATLKPFRGY